MNRQGPAVLQMAGAPSPQQSARSLDLAQNRRAGLAWSLCLALLAFAVRAPGLFAGFVFDDVVSFEQRSRAELSRIPSFFTSDQSALFGSNFYRPVLNTWYELFFALFNTHPAAWHALSILLHVACTVLVFHLALRIIERPFAAAVAAALFAVHPAHVEAVYWASAVADPLWTVLMLCSVLAFLRWMEQGSAVWFAASLLTGSASIFTKEPAVMMPLILLATGLALRDRAKPGLRILLATAPLFVVDFIFLAIRRSVLHGSFSHPVTAAASTAQMVLTWPAALLFYLRHMIWPGVVVPFYPLRIVEHWNSAAFLCPLLSVAIVSSVLVYLLWRAAGWRRSLLCLAWTLLPLAPALYLKAFVRFELVHDRFLYAPLVGFCLGAALVLQWATERIEAVTRFRVFVIVTVALVPLLALESISQGLWWQNDKTLFTRALAVTPDNPKAFLDLGSAVEGDGNVDKAKALFRRALDLDPHNSGALFALGHIAWTEHDDIAAENFLLRAVTYWPTYDMWLHLASIHLHKNELRKAEIDVLQAEALRPDGAGVHVAKGMLLLNKNDAAGAIREFQEELRNHPGSEPALAGLARATGKSQR